MVWWSTHWLQDQEVRSSNLGVDKKNSRGNFHNFIAIPSLGKLRPEHLFKPYMKPLSGTPEIGFRYGLNKFSGPNFPKPYPKPYLDKSVENPPCPLRGRLRVRYGDVSKVSGPRSKDNILESENANEPLK